MIELRHGRWQDVLGDENCDLFLSDPPYGARTHGKHRTDGARDAFKHGRPLGYDALSDDDVREVVGHWARRTRGWFCAMTSHDLVSVYREALEAAGRYVFAPVACVQSGMNIRLAGDGPSNWTVYLVVSRPRTMRAWGTLRGAYVGTPHDPGARYEYVPGGKPLWLMRAIVRDYSRPGDMVCDPFGGAGTTLLAARDEGRLAIGAEMDRERYELAQRNLRAGHSLSLFREESA